MMKSIKIYYLIFVVTLIATNLYAQNIASCDNENESRFFLEGQEEGVVLISLQDLPEASELFDNIDSEDSVNNQLFQKFLEILVPKININSIGSNQLEIAVAAASVNMVYILVNSITQQYELVNNCSEISEEFCKKIEENMIRFIIIPHDAAWIRDFGPHCRIDNNKVTILDPSYHDSRVDDEREKALRLLNQWRIEIANTILSVFQEQDILRYEHGNFEASSDIENYNIYLNACTALYDVYEKKYVKRYFDDEASGLIVSEILDVEKSNFEKVDDLNMDGGNLLRSTNCDCFLTTDVITKNQLSRQSILSILEEKFLCKKIVFLDPLPEAIKHVDMFLLPVKGDKLILASYDPSFKFLEKEWLSNDVSKEIAKEAHIVMENNFQELKSRGFDVIKLPSPLPRESNRGIYYPTLLNLLLQKGRNDEGEVLQILAPVFENVDQDLIRNSIKIIEETFKDNYPSSQIFIKEIESTNPAKLQGGIHCLTNTIPIKFLKNSEVSSVDILESLEVKLYSIHKEYFLDGTWQVMNKSNKLKILKVHIQNEIIFKFKEVKDNVAKGKVYANIDNRETPIFTYLMYKNLYGELILKIFNENTDEYTIFSVDKNDRNHITIENFDDNKLTIELVKTNK